MEDITSKRRKLVIMRHAERVDFTFGNWMEPAFDEHGNYIRFNLNMPVSVPKRNPMDFQRDCPLTRIGTFQATITGESMKEHGLSFSHVFCSPSLRCIQTCSDVLKASNQSHLPINIEPALFEWCGWYKDIFPEFLGLEDMKANDYNVALDYKPVVSVDDLRLGINETSEEFYMRSFLTTKTLLDTYDGDLLFVGHAATLDTCSRQLIGKMPRNNDEVQRLMHHIMYAAVAIVEKDSENVWELVDPPFPALKHTSNASFNWKVFL
ncbi:ecdysteroid-phosphate phosphatase-like [Uloborus diversus]|uniref:ecdysteroid-phosphate phosphatase-like n=1 Tax=Uloborus diversus TaxID=327109 RepID=UPI002409061D|nr:ecdysteroid-phosphate phosphatase-like [Uloborus diversus]